MDTARHHWNILLKLGTDLANRVRLFMVTGWDGEGVALVTENGESFWFGKMKFGWQRLKPTTEPTPLNVADIVSMAQGNDHILLLNKCGEIYSMGRNEYGQLGLGTVDEQTHFSPQLILSPHKFISVGCGHGHSLALTDDGKVWAWGRNDFGQVGGPKSTDSLPSPHQICKLNSHQVVAVECGGWHSLALTDRGEVYGWGWNGMGQIGHRRNRSKHTPTRIPTRRPVKSVVAGFEHTLLLTQSGKVYACGDNAYGQLGLPTDIEFSTTLSKVTGLPPILQIASHPDTKLSIAMSFDHRCFVWGELVNGKLEEEEMDFNIKSFTPRELPLVYSTVESPFSSFSTYRCTPHSVLISETPSNRLSVGLSRMFDNPETSDVQFVVEQRTIHAHRIILSNFSDYFSRRFSERWLERSSVDPEDPTIKVTILDHSYEVFHAFLRFLYTDCLEVHSDLLPEMFDLASQYLQSNMQKLCLSRMRINLTPSTCCLYYQLSHRHSLPELATFQQELVQFASTRMSEIAATAVYQSMEPDIVDNLTNAVQNLPCT